MIRPLLSIKSLAIVFALASGCEVLEPTESLSGDVSVVLDVGPTPGDLGSQPDSRATDRATAPDGAMPADLGARLDAGGTASDGATSGDVGSARDGATPAEAGTDASSAPDAGFGDKDAQPAFDLGRPIDAGALDLCALAPEPGPCEAIFPRWFFNAESGRCETFRFGGCEGNENNFETRSACESRCGRACGGFVGPTCSADEFCDFEGDGCDILDAQGVCRPRPQICLTVLSPVCGCDGLSYGNRCEAHRRGVDAAEPGPCTESGCEPSECGPPLGGPSRLCDDGSVGGPVCTRLLDGSCGWMIRTCPD